ncbi:bidirectional sugar transporter SWEET4-like [Impatiens glandulifera]|uniref:bidirectional sugar transporter SWEET4-like n=1 Tax=Impatiens glandulifera TaxID=253017 RepID=UPI001FB15CAD|nr:bidirectional sugar transporter SWEET4-like [Impatiens glandulifera]
MVSLEEIRTAVGLLGNVIALMLFMSPVPTFLAIYKKKSVEQYSPVPYIATIVNCALWVVYGLPIVHPHSLLVVTINGAGFCIQLIYLFIFVIYSNKRMRLRVVSVVLAEMAFVAVLAVLVLNLTHSTKLRSTIIGSICMVGNIFMYASPLSVMKLVITTKSVEYMPFTLSLATFANAVCWTIYGTITDFDPNIAAPNGLGILFAVAQLIIYAIFYKSTKKKLAEEKIGRKNTEMVAAV